MAKVPIYSPGTLPSAQTPTPSADKSGQVIGNSVATVASSLIASVANFFKTQQDNLDESRRVKTLGDYSSDILTGAEAIKQAHVDDPVKALEALQELRDTTKEKYLSGLGNDRLRQVVATDFERVNAEQKIKDVAWQVQQTHALTQQNYLDQIGAGAKFLSSSGKYEDFLVIADELSKNQQNYEKAFGVGKGQDTVDKGLLASAKATIYGMVDKGKSFEAAQLLIGGKFDPFISAEEKRNLIEGVDKAQKGAQTRSEFLTAAKAVTATFGTSKAITAGDMTVGDVEERISQTSFDLARAVRDNAPASQIQIFKNQEEALISLRNAKLAAISSIAKDDIETKGKLLAQYQTLVKYDKTTGKNSLQGTLVDISNFQRDAAKAYYEGKLSSATYSGWMEYARAAIISDIQNNLEEGKKGYKTDQGFFGLGQSSVLNKLAGNTPDGKKVRRGLEEILRGADTKEGRAVAVDTMDFYLDDLNDVTQGDLSQMNTIGEEAHKNMISRAKLKARLKSMGYPVYLTVGDQIPTSAGLFTITGHDADGMPLVDISKINVGK